MSAISLAHLLTAQTGGVYRLRGALSPSRLAALAQGHSLACFEADLGRVRSKRGTMAALARALAFPNYFGANWDALADCLTDFGWAPASGYIIRLRGTQPLARSAPRDYATLVEILHDAAGQWAQRNVPFYVLLDDAESAGDNLPLAEAG